MLPKRWAKFPFLTNQTRMVATAKVCGATSNDQSLAVVLVVVDNFNFLGGNEVPSGSSIQSSPQTPLSTKRTIRDLWDRTDVDGIGGSPPTKRPLPFNRQDSQDEVPGTPCASSPPIDLGGSVDEFRISRSSSDIYSNHYDHPNTSQF